MESDVLNQEVLLNTNTKFCKRDFCEINKSKDANTLPQKEQLKTLCWNGVITELLPEISAKKDNRQLTLWEVLETEELLHLRFGNYQELPEAQYSLNPYLIMDVACLN